MLATLTMQDEKVQSPAAAPATMPDTVLVVDDDPMVGILVLRLLAPLGLRGVHVSDAAACLCWLDAHPGAVALVVMDCGLPDAREGRLAFRLRDQVPEMPLLLTSGRLWPDVFRAVAITGPTDFISKPFGPGELIQRARRLLAHVAVA